jgi:ubiquinone/menaquinone biosynthesis C-methylase UbiE
MHFLLLNFRKFMLLNDYDYVHGYSDRENVRLVDQANTLSELLHRDTVYPSGSRVLEAGCGVGAQTLILAENSPDAKFISIDISPKSLEAAQKQVSNAGFKNIDFQLASIFDMPFDENSFDHIFVCFVLEHLNEPAEALKCLKKVLKPGGTITVIEGDHGSAYYFPESSLAQKAINCLVELQARAGGNSLIGRQLFPLLSQAGYRNICVTPRQVYCDSSRPEWVEGFTRNTFNAMVEGVREDAIRNKLMEPEEWEAAISDLHKTAAENGTFNYTFFKGVGEK